VVLLLLGASAAEITVSSDSWPSEVSWTLACSDGATTVSGGSPFAGSSTALPGATCTLTMYDSYGDGWDGALWSGLGQSFSLRAGSSQAETFVVPPSLPSPPPTPPALPRFPPPPISIDGPCSLVGDCLRSPYFPSAHGTLESCTIVNVPLVPLFVTHFKTGQLEEQYYYYQPVPSLHSAGCRNYREEPPLMPISRM
jgi:hypothetical protein